MSAVLRPAFLLVALVLQLSLPLGTRGQVSAPGCQPGFEWSYNSLNQTPCLVGAYLESVCEGGVFHLGALAPGNTYAGPLATQANPCFCNTVTYSLLEACSVCQGNGAIPLSVWNSNCSLPVPDGQLPIQVPGETRVPQWAFQQIGQGGIWNGTAAQSVGDGVESTASVQPSSASAPSPSHTSSNSPSANKSHTGAIVGGVIGGVVGVAILAGVAAFFFMRHRRNKQPEGPFPDMHEAHGGIAHSSSFSPPSAGPPPKLYDPNDPSTFPTSPGGATIKTTFHNGAQNRKYNGLPEV